MRPIVPRHAAAMALATLGAVTCAVAFAADVNIHASRQPALILPLLDAFTKETGLTIATISIERASRSG